MSWVIKVASAKFESASGGAIALDKCVITSNALHTVAHLHAASDRIKGSKETAAEQVWKHAISKLVGV